MWPSALDVESVVTVIVRALGLAILEFEFGMPASKRLAAGGGWEASLRLYMTIHPA